MQRTLSEVRPAPLADQLSGLAKLHDSALKERWRTLYQTAPPARMRRELPGYAEYITRTRFRMIPYVW